MWTPGGVLRQNVNSSASWSFVGFHPGGSLLLT